MSRHDQELDEMIRLLLSLIEHAQFGMRVKAYDDCNSCGRRNCKYMPNPGEAVRINCPLWEDRL